MKFFRFFPDGHSDDITQKLVFYFEKADFTERFAEYSINEIPSSMLNKYWNGFYKMKSDPTLNFKKDGLFRDDIFNGES